MGADPLPPTAARAGYPSLTPRPEDAEPPSKGSAALSWIRAEDRAALASGGFSAGAHGDLATLTGVGGGSFRAGVSAGGGSTPIRGAPGGPDSRTHPSATRLPESPRAAAPIGVVVAEVLRVPPPVRVPPPAPPPPALVAAERKAAAAAAGAPLDDGPERAAHVAAEEPLPTFLEVADPDPRAAAVARLVDAGMTPREAHLSLLVGGPQAAESADEAARALGHVRELLAMGFPESRVLGALVRYGGDPEAAAEACILAADAP